MSEKITSLQNPTVKRLVRLRTDPHFRKQEGSLLISGVKLVKELSNKLSPKHIFSMTECSDSYTLVSESIMKKITGLTSPEAIAAEFPLPKPTKLIDKSPILILDQINDPGNMGTLIRTALALGWAGLFLLPKTVDPFHEKVIRASRGALFSLPWQEGSWEALVDLGLTLYTADIVGTPIAKIERKKEIGLILSNEAQGVSNNGASIGERITIPMPGTMESLNVAVSGGILMYALRGLDG